MSLTLKEIKKMLKAWHFYKASSLLSESGNLKKTVSLIEGAVEALPATNREAVQLHYYECVPIESIAAKQCVSWQCEEALNLFGLLAKHPTTGQPIQSPYVIMRREFQRQANMIWAQIFQTVQQNSEVPVSGNHNEDIMEKILTGKI